MKGESVSTSHLIFFIAALIAVSIVVSLVTSSIKTLGYAVEEKAKDTTKQLYSYIKIVEAYYYSDQNTVRLYVKNVGRTELPVHYFDVFLEGNYMGSCGTLTCVEFTVVDRLLQPGELLEINIPAYLPAGSYDLKVAGAYGVEAEYTLVVG